MLGGAAVVLSQVWSFSGDGVWDQLSDHALVSNHEHLDWAELLDSCGFAPEPCYSGGSLSGFSIEIYVASDGGFLVVLRDSMCRYWLILVDRLPNLFTLFSSGLPELIGIPRGGLIDIFREVPGVVRVVDPLSVHPHLSP